MEQCGYTMMFRVDGMGDVPGQCDAEATATAPERIGFDQRDLQLCAAHVAVYNATPALATVGDDRGRSGTAVVFPAILAHTGRESGVRYSGPLDNPVITPLPQSDAGVCVGHAAGLNRGGFDCECNCAVCWGRSLGTS